jgi:hypothetical protein
MITKLTKKQESKFKYYVDKWINIGLNTDEVDMVASVLAVKKAYEVAKINPPKYFVGPVAGPYEAAIAEALVHMHVKNKTVFSNAREFNERILREVDEYIASKKNNLKLTIDNQIYGFHEYWLSYYDFFKTECELNLSDIQPLIDLASVCGWWTPMTDVAIIQNKPSQINRDDQNRLHSVDGPAIKYRGSENSISNVYAVHGVRVNKKIIDRDFTAKDIDNERNAEVRRVMIELYGQSKYLIDSNAEVVHSDDFGTLYRKEIPGDEPLMMVKVVNSTVEPDGTFKDYFIRVDPNVYGGLKTARAAVASTWRNNDANRTLIFKNPEDYNPDIET